MRYSGYGVKNKGGRGPLFNSLKGDREEVQYYKTAELRYLLCGQKMRMKIPNLVELHPLGIQIPIAT